MREQFPAATRRTLARYHQDLLQHGQNPCPVGLNGQADRLLGVTWRKRWER